MMSRLLELPVKTVIPYVNSIIPDILFFFVLCFLLLSVFETFYCFFLLQSESAEKVKKEFFKLLLVTTFLFQSVGAYFLFKAILSPAPSCAYLLDDGLNLNRFLSKRGMQANLHTIIIRVL